MSEPFLAEIRVFGFNFPPRRFAQCDGQILPISQNQSLYSLLGTTYGGDGRTSFGLPDLRGRTPVHEGYGITLGERGGEENHTLTEAEMPEHNHQLSVSTDQATSGTPGGDVLFAKATQPTYHAPGSDVAGHVSNIASVGASQAHENMQPYLTVNFCIAIQGLFPSRS